MGTGNGICKPEIENQTKPEIENTRQKPSTRSNFFNLLSNGQTLQLSLS